MDWLLQRQTAIEARLADKHLEEAFMNELVDHARCCQPRREFLRIGSLSLLGLSLRQYLELEAATPSTKGSRRKAQACILLWLEGGPSQIDTWDPKPHSQFKAIPTKAGGVQISELFPRIAGHMDKLAIVRSMHTEENNHPQGTHYALTGHRPNPALKFPSLGSITSKELGGRNNLPPYIMVPEHQETDFFSYIDAYTAAFLGSEYDPIILPDPNREAFQIPDLSLPDRLSAADIANRRSFLGVVDRAFRHKEKQAEFGKMDRFTNQALTMLLSPSVKQAFDLSQESDETKEAYGRTRVGQSVLLARRLVEAGCRFVTTSGYTHGAWDTHKDNDQVLRDRLAPTLDQTLSALLEDLHQRGLLESTVVLAMGEFGRTPHLNANNGRDHYPDCWSVLLGGGGIQGVESWAPVMIGEPRWQTGWSPWETSSPPYTRPWASTGPRPISTPGADRFISQIRSTTSWGSR